MTTRILRAFKDSQLDSATTLLSSEVGKVQLEIFDNEEGLVARVQFTHVCAYRFANESHAIGLEEDAINRVVEIIDSPWPSQLNKPSLWPFVKRHFAIFVESVGYYELLAEEMHFHD